jgi:hypothetical protein
MTDYGIICLLSHKCGPVTHELGGKIRDVLRGFDIDLLIDPFRPGDDIETRMRTFDIDAFVFLASAGSLASDPCRFEFETARRRSVPLFVAHLEGELPEPLRQRNHWKPPSPEDPAFAAKVGGLASAIRSRVEFARDAALLRTNNLPQDAQDAARRIALKADRTAIAEFVPLLTQRYLEVEDDPTVRYWIALALGKAGTAEAAEALKQLPPEDHPYALEGIRQALEMVAEEPKSEYFPRLWWVEE